MRELVINELGSDEVKAVEDYLDDNLESGGLGGVFWLAIPDTLLAEAQQGHEKCGGYIFSVELGRDFVSFELLVRSRINLHCSCTSYASEEQRQFLLGFFDEMIKETKVKS
jgi:hypothetical protein